MAVGYARPDVGTLVFRLFNRALHPELLTVFAETEIRQPKYSARVQIGEAGHIITVRYANRLVTEVITSAEHPLPHNKQLLARRLRGHRDESLADEGGLQYQGSFQVEQLDPEVFLHFQTELVLDSSRCRVAHRFEPSNRMSPAPLSFIQSEACGQSLLIHAFHTFPHNFAVVKTQSLFEL